MRILSNRLATLCVASAAMACTDGSATGFDASLADSGGIDAWSPDAAPTSVDAMAQPDAYFAGGGGVLVVGSTYSPEAEPARLELAPAGLGLMASFGSPLSMDGERLIAGASWSPDPAVPIQVRAAFVYRRTGDRWDEEGRLEWSPVPYGFGDVMLLSGETALVSASTGPLVYGWSAGEWTPRGTLALPQNAEALALDGDTVALGYTLWPPLPSETCEAAIIQVLTRTQDVWTEQGHIVRPAYECLAPGGLAVSGDTLAALDWGGPAHVFVRVAGAWIEEAVLKPAGFGEITSSCSPPFVALALCGDIAVIGFPFDRENYGGSAYVFARAAGRWRQEAKLLPSDTTDHHAFGLAVACTADGLVVVGAPTTTNSTVAHPGSVYLFTRGPERWEAAGVLRSGKTGWDGFGITVALSGRWLAIRDIRNLGGPGGRDTVFLYDLGPRP